MKTLVTALVLLSSIQAIAGIQTMEPTDTTTVLQVDNTIKIKIVRYEDNTKGNTCYVMIPTGTYQNNRPVSANPVSVTAGITCVKN
jgi:hypothetical protein